jgi:hypothetical protein
LRVLLLFLSAAAAAAAPMQPLADYLLFCHAHKTGGTTIEV